MQEIDDLILKAQQGDADAEVEVLSRYAGLVKSVAFSYYVTVAELDSEDLVQVGMIALMRALRSFHAGEDATFETYASRCVRNAIIDVLRKAEKASMAVDPLCEDIPAPPPTIDTLSEAILSVLSVQESAVLQLRLQAWSYKEIAEKLGMERKRVDNLIASAKRKIKKFTSD